MKKFFIYLSTLFLVGLKPVLGAVPGPGGSFSTDSIFSIFQGILSNISGIFSFGWLQGNEIGFLKFLLWLLVFTIFFAVGQIVFARFGGTGTQPRRLALIVSLILATSTTLLTPNSLVASLFSAYATLIIFVFMAVIIGGIIWLLYGPWLSSVVTGTALHAIRIIGILLCWWILAEITAHADAVTGTTTFQYVLPMLFISFKRIRSKDN